MELKNYLGLVIGATSADILANPLGELSELLYSLI